MEVGLSLGFKLVELYEYEERYPKSFATASLAFAGGLEERTGIPKS